MMDATKILAVALLAVAADWACSTSTESADTGNLSELAPPQRGVDHAAIVEVTTMMLAGKPTASILDPYNQEDPFAITSATFVETFADRLEAFDAYDGETDWSPEQSSAWTARVAAGNYLVVDTSKPCDFNDPHTYLEIERAQLTGREHATCGGRMPNEDALDVTLNFLIRGPAASAQDEGALSDGVDQATHESVDSFPYLAEMNGI
jgi:hypothetical protein